MGTRFRPADPDAVRSRFAAIRARALERVASEQRLILERLASERGNDKEPADEAAPHAPGARGARGPRGHGRRRAAEPAEPDQE